MELATVETEQQSTATSSELAALQDIGELVAGGVNFDALFRTLLDKLMDVFGFQLAAIYLLDPQEEFIRGYIARGDALDWIDESIRSMDENDILCHIVKKKEPKIEIIAGRSPLFYPKTYDSYKHSGLVRAFCPISDGNRVIGVLEVGYRREIRKRIEAQQVKTLRSFLNLIEVGLQKLSRNEAILHELEMLINVADPELALESLVRRGVVLLDADRGSIRLGKNDILEPVVWYERGNTSRLSDKPPKLRKGEGIVGYVWQSGKFYNCMDSSKDPRFYPHYDDSVSDMAAPILSSSGQIFGVFNFTSNKKKHFNYRSIQILRTLSILAANVIDRSFFAETMRGIDKAAEEMGYLDFLRFVIENARSLIGIPASFTIWERDETTESLRHIDLGLDDDVFSGIEFPISSSVTGEAIIKRKPLAIYNIWEEPCKSMYKAPEPAKAAGLQSLLSIPIMLLGYPMGAINVHTKRKYEFSDREQNRMSAFASAVATAIERNKHVQEADNLKKIIQRTAGLDLDSALRATAELVRDFTRSDCVAILLLRNDGPGFLPAVRVGHKYEVGTPRHGGGTQKILKSQEHRFVEDAANDPMTAPGIIGLVKSYIGLLIANPDESFGVMYIDFFQSRKFPERFRDHLTTLADEASLVIGSILMRERINKNMERVYRSAVDKVAADTAHMIGNELSPLATRVYILRDKLKLGELSDVKELQKELEYLGNLVRNARSLVKEVRDFGGDFQLNPEEESLSKLMSELMDSTIEEPNSFSIEDQGQPWIALIDKARMTVVFRELIQNSLDIVDGTTKIRISLGDYSPDPRKKFVRIIYSDNGPGVPKQLKERIFEKFFSRRPGRERRTGLGLHYVRGIVTRHGGEIIECGKYGEGAEFHVVLPLADDTRTES